MSYSSKPLTALELYEIRTKLRQSPTAMGELLGVGRAAYYHWERTGKIPKSVAIAARFLAAQTQIAENPTESTRPTKGFKARFLPGARFGKLVVIASLPRPRGSRHTCVHVRCDCGNNLSMQTREIEKRSQCGNDCRLRNWIRPWKVTGKTLKVGSSTSKSVRLRKRNKIYETQKQTHRFRRSDGSSCQPS
jgi:hypothetical protein